MVVINSTIQSMLNSPVRQFSARVELHWGSSRIQNFKSTDKLMSFTVERVCEEGKFFGFGICQHAKVKILDVNREVPDIDTNCYFKIYYGVNDEYLCPHPTFYVTQCRRDENTNELTLYGYDIIHAASSHAISEVDLELPYSIGTMANRIASFLSAAGSEFQRVSNTETSITTLYEEGANLDGTELIRDVMDDMAEATQTIYFVNANNRLVFKRLSDTISPDLAITKANYIELETKAGRRLNSICHTTELGDNVSAKLNITGTTQYIRDNAFWEKREDIDVAIDEAVAVIGGLSITQFDCSWRGNYLLEPGDKIALTTKDNNTVISFVLDDTIEYDGTLKENTKWSYSDDSTESESNPTSLGDILNKTTAKVDKVNQTIDLTVSKVEGQDSRLTALELNSESITASVQQIQSSTESRLDAMGNEIDTLTNRVEATMTPEAVEIKIQEAIGDGVNKVITETGFRFDDEGLTVSKSGSEMTTTINEDGMIVYKDGTEVLTADNTGVHAIDLRAETYLHIGTYSRFQDYGEGRTGCFWIV